MKILEGSCAELNHEQAATLYKYLLQFKWNNELPSIADAEKYEYELRKSPEPDGFWRDNGIKFHRIMGDLYQFLFKNKFNPVYCVYINSSIMLGLLEIFDEYQDKYPLDDKEQSLKAFINLTYCLRLANSNAAYPPC